MTVTTENKSETLPVQEKVDTNLTQVKVDTILDQKEASQEIKEGDQENPNWRAFREARKKDRAEKEAAERKAQEKETEITALKAAMEAAFSKSAPSPQAYQQYYGNASYDQTEESEDEKIEKKVNALLAKREQQYKQESAEREHREYPNRLAREFPDFNHVIAQENLDYIDFHYPEVSRPLQRLQDGYDKWYDIYHAVKKFVPNVVNAKRDAAKADANYLKPKSISSSTITQSGEPVRSSWQEMEQKRADNWARMQRVLKGV